MCIAAQINAATAKAPDAKQKQNNNMLVADLLPWDEYIYKKTLFYLFDAIPAFYVYRNDDDC